MRLKDVAERNPVEETQKRLQRDEHERGLLRVVQDVLQELVDERKLLIEAILKLQDLGLRHLTAAKVEDLLREELEDLHVVLADGLAIGTRCDELGDERLPLARPLLLHHLITKIGSVIRKKKKKAHTSAFISTLLLRYLNQHLIELTEHDSLALHNLGRLGVLNHQVHNVALDGLTLLTRQNLPAKLDERLEYLQRQGFSTTRAKKN